MKYCTGGEFEKIKLAKKQKKASKKKQEGDLGDPENENQREERLANWDAASNTRVYSKPRQALGLPGADVWRVYKILQACRYISRSNCSIGQ